MACWLLMGACSTRADGGSDSPSARIVRHLAAMGTELRVEVAAVDRATALRASEAAIRAVELAEAQASTWRMDSPLAQWNAAEVGAEPAIPADLATALGRASGWARDTGGAFDPCIGTLVEAYDLRGAGRWPEPAALQRARAAAGFEHLQMAPHGPTRSAPIRIEEGGFAKGWALDRALAAAEGAGAVACLVDLGGQWLVAGTELRLAVADPDRRDVALVELSIPSGSVATTGNGERGRTVEGRRLGHVLDPRSGAPADDFGSVTVWAACGIDADCLATALFVLGPTAAVAWAETRPGIEVLTVARNAAGWDLRATRGMRAAVIRQSAAVRWRLPAPEGPTHDG